MTRAKRVFVLGAGFSNPAGMPLATRLLPLLEQRLDDDQMKEWLADLQMRLTWLDGDGRQENPRAVGIEEVFHFAPFDAEVFRLRQQRCPVGRHDGPATPWNRADSIEAWLSHLEESLRDVLLAEDDKADLAPIKRWAQTVDVGDAVLTFNYDTLVERSLAALGKPWNHGFESERNVAVPVFKMHGSIDWIVADRREQRTECDLLFDKVNQNRTEEEMTGHIEDDYRLWRCQTRDRLKTWLPHRHLQLVQEGAAAASVGIAGLGTHKQLHSIPGLGETWMRGMRSLYKADVGIVVGFSMSDFDMMAQLQFAEVARARLAESRPLPIVVIDPGVNEATKERFRRVFRFVDFVVEQHQCVDWSRY